MNTHSLALLFRSRLLYSFSLVYSNFYCFFFLGDLATAELDISGVWKSGRKYTSIRLVWCATRDSGGPSRQSNFTPSPQDGEHAPRAISKVVWHDKPSSSTKTNIITTIVSVNCFCYFGTYRELVWNECYFFCAMFGRNFSLVLFLNGVCYEFVPLLSAVGLSL